MNLLVKKIHPDATEPRYGSEYAAGLDLCAYGGYILEPGTRQLISTGICVEWITNSAYTDKYYEDKPYHYYLRIAPRSGLAVKHQIDIGAGVVDYDYRGELKVCVINNSQVPYIISHGDRIAQGILERIEHFDAIEVVENLSETSRGIGGFGSTGKN
jgi:dUTP pyrophosphatase